MWSNGQIKRDWWCMRTAVCNKCLQRSSKADLAERFGEYQMAIGEGRSVQRPRLFPCNGIDPVLKLSIVCGGSNHGFRASERGHESWPRCPLDPSITPLSPGTTILLQLQDYWEPAASERLCSDSEGGCLEQMTSPHTRSISETASRSWNNRGVVQWSVVPWKAADFGISPT